MGQRHQTYLITRNDDKRVVLPYHNQWLYGRSAVFNAAKVLQTAKKYTSKDQYNYRRLEENQLGEFWRAVQMMQDNSGGEKGSIGMTFFHYEGIDFPIMKDFIDRGDNNDGITIIDIDNLKYCFMAFSGIEADKQIPNYAPVDAHTYLDAYYPGWKTYKGTDISEDCLHALELMKDFKVLTLAELRKLFPLQEEFKEKVNS